MTVVAPVKDEEHNLRPLLQQLRDALVGVATWELVVVDDGSSDGSFGVLQQLAREDDRVRPIRLDRNHGQSSALWAGIQRARGPIIATIDADLQQDPADLCALLARLERESVDAVVGYRVGRRDTLVRRLSSRLANAVRNGISGDRVRDTGCSLKVFRREAIQGLAPFEGMHRFLPTLLRQRGHLVVEEPVSHRPRISGRSKYGIRNRALRATLDLLAVRWMASRALDPTLLDGTSVTEPDSHVSA